MTLIDDNEEYKGWYVLELLEEARREAQEEGYMHGLMDGREEAYSEISKEQS